MSIQDLIAAASDRLTPTDRRIAQAVLESPTLLAFGTVSDLAEQVGTSRPSVVRFATKLGFSGYSDLQGWARDQVTHQLTSPSQRIRQQRGETSSVRASIDGAIAAAFESLTDAHLAALVTPVVQARKVWILSGETSMAGAHTLHSGLTMARADVHLVLEHFTGRDLSSASSNDVVVAFDFARYRRHCITTARAFVDIGVPLIAITDGPLSPLSPIAAHWCELHIPAVGPFDSSVPAVVAAEVIVSELVEQLGDEARERIDTLESLWQATGTFFDHASHHT